MIGSNEDDGLILTTALTTDPSLYILYRYEDDFSYLWTQVMTP